jgi:predicted alpha/beta-hydrolase family hydrolase
VTYRVYLGHGASGSAASMRPHVDGLVRRGIEAYTVPAEGRLPMPAERAVPVFVQVAGDLASAVLGGQSYGGRVASMGAAEHGCAALLLFSYPLHRPGHPDELRTEHWPKIECPVLFLSGEADPFARIDLLREAVKTLKRAELVTYPRTGHGLKGATLEDALDRAATFVSGLGLGGK